MIWGWVWREESWGLLGGFWFVVLVNGYRVVLFSERGDWEVVKLLWIKKNYICRELDLFNIVGNGILFGDGRNWYLV